MKYKRTTTIEEIDAEFFETLKNIKQIPKQQSNKFIQGILEVGSERALTIEESLREPQMDDMYFYFLGAINKKTTLIDFGCASSGNLFFVFNNNDTEKKLLPKIKYFGIDLTIDYREIINKDFDKIIKYFANTKKAISEVFFQNIYDFFDRYDDSSDLADVILIKNVNHEKTLLELPSFLSDIFKLTKHNGKIIFFDLGDLKKGEKKSVPWDINDYRKLFKEFLKYPQVDLYTLPESTIRKTPLNYCIIVNTKKKRDFNTDFFKKKLLKFYEYREDKLIKQKNDLYKRENQNENTSDNFIKCVTYHSNLAEQIREAEKKWNF